MENKSIPNDPTLDHGEQHRANVFAPSAAMSPETPMVSGIDFNHYQAKGRDVTVAELLGHMSHTGYQASTVADAVRVINHMRSWDSSSEIFLGFTSNLVSSGLRSTLRWLVEHRHVTCIVATAGGVEEDIIKCLAPTYCATFSADDAALRESHINRIGNLRVPNNNYLTFEDWINPILNKMLDEQEASDARFWAKRDAVRDAWLRKKTQSAEMNLNKEINDKDMDMPLVEEDADSAVRWTPSSFLARLGQEIDDKSSILYWAARHKIPVYCPALTDGSIGDMLAQFTVRSQNRPRAATLTIDITRDIDAINMIARRAELYHRKMGAIILGGGLVKHHIMNACLQGGGADAAVYINTAVEADGSDAGARPEEAVSWGKLKADAQWVKVWAEATIVWPMIVAGTWAKIRAIDRAEDG